MSAGTPARKISDYAIRIPPQNAFPYCAGKHHRTQGKSHCLSGSRLWAIGLLSGWRRRSRLRAQHRRLRDQSPLHPHASIPVYCLTLTPPDSNVRDSRSYFTQIVQPTYYFGSSVSLINESIMSLLIPEQSSPQGSLYVPK